MKFKQIIKQTLFPADDFQKAVRGYNLSRNPQTWDTICQAPFTNMYIGHHGVITACCYNTTQTLGVWPFKTLTEIWWGAKAEKFRKALQNYDLSHGCDICYRQLMARNYDALKAGQFNQNKANQNGFPSSIEFELDNKCNLGCTMCNENFSSVIAHNKGLKAYHTPYDEGFIEQLKPFIPYLQDAKFYGGEPFMIKIYYEIWEMIQQVNPPCRINIQTNGTIMNKRVEKLLEKPFIHFNISIDSLKKEVYESIRVGAEYEVTMRNFNHFLEYSRKHRTHLGISSCMMQNTVREAPDFIRFCNERDIQIYFHTVVQPEEMSIKNMSKTELQSILRYLKEQKFDPKTVTQKGNVHHYGDFVKQVAYWLSQKNVQEKNPSIKPVKNWEEFFQRITEACISVYGEESGIKKAKQFKIRIDSLINSGVITHEERVFEQVKYEDLSSSIHRIVDLSVEELKRMYQSSVTG